MSHLISNLHSIHEALLYVIKIIYFGICSKLLKMTMINKTYYKHSRALLWLDIVSFPLSSTLPSLNYHIWVVQLLLSLTVPPKIVHLEHQMIYNKDYRIMLLKGMPLQEGRLPLSGRQCSRSGELKQTLPRWTVYLIGLDVLLREAVVLEIVTDSRSFSSWRGSSRSSSKSSSTSDEYYFCYIN